MIKDIYAANGKEPGTQTHHHLDDLPGFIPLRTPTNNGVLHLTPAKKWVSVASLESRCEDFLALAIQKTARHHEGFPRQPYEAVDPVDHSGSSSATE